MARVTAKDLAALKPGKWLTSDIINAVLVLIVARQKKLRAERASALAAGVAAAVTEPH